MILGIDAFNLRSGGGITHLVEFLKSAGLPRYGFTKVIVWGSSGTLSKISNQEWLVKDSQKLLDGGFFLRIYWQRFKLKNLALRANCDVLFVPGGSDSSGFHPIVTMSRNILPFDYCEVMRYGISFSSLKFILLRFVQSRTFMNSDGLIFLNEYARKKISSIVDILPSKLSIIPHGVSRNFFPNSSRVYRLNSEFTKISPCKFLYVSSVEAYKHQWVVAEAVAQLKAEGYPVALDIVGPSGGGMSRLTKTLRRLDANGEFLRYLGPVPYDILSEVYQDADIGIFASTCENMPNTLVEYMAAGLPIACSNRGPMPEILKSYGIYFDPESVDSIKFALIELMSSYDLRISLSASAFEGVKDYSWEKCADETLRFLSEIVSTYKNKGSN